MGPYDSLWQIAPCLTEIYSSLKFCQTVILGDFLSDTDEFLSHFIEFLSNTQGYLDSLLFCQCPQSCLTELFVCLTEFRLGLTELPKNVKTEIFLPKLLFLIKRDCSAGVLCANLAVSLFIFFSAAPNLVFHHHSASRTRGCEDIQFGRT